MHDHLQSWRARTTLESSVMNMLLQAPVYSCDVILYYYIVLYCNIYIYTHISIEKEPGIQEALSFK